MDLPKQLDAAEAQETAERLGTAPAEMKSVSLDEPGDEYVSNVNYKAYRAGRSLFFPLYRSG